MFEPMIRIASEFSRSLGRRGCSAASVGGAQTGHGGAMSYTGLIADADHAEAGGEEFFDQVVFFVVESRAAEVGDGDGSASDSGRLCDSTKVSLAAFPEAVGDHVHRLLEIEVFPLL